MTPASTNHIPAPPGARRTVVLPARPEPIELPVELTAVIVVDMQNGYASVGGYRDLAGKDVGPAAIVVERTRKVLEAARSAGLTVVY